MTKRIQYCLHLGSNVLGKVPPPDLLKQRELAINFSKGGERLYIKNTANEIVPFINETEINNKLNEYQTLLKSGKNIKTINNISLLGSGNIQIDGSGGPIEYIEFITGSNKIKTLQNVPINKRLVVATINSSMPLSINGTIKDGWDIHIIVKNNGKSPITVSIPNVSPYVALSGDVLNVKNGETKEINALSDGKNIYIRTV